MRSFLAAIVVLVLGACGGKGDDALDKMEGFKSQVCACADKECAEQAMKDMEAYLETWSKNNASVKPTKEQADRSERITNAMDECLKKLEKK